MAKHPLIMVKQRLGAGLAAFDALSVRERVLTALVVLAALVGLGQLLWVDPLTARYQAATERLLQAQTRFAELETQAGALSAAHPATASRDHAARRLQLQRLAAEVDEQLRERVVDLVDARRMASVLEGLLARHGAVELHALTSLAATTVDTGSAEDLVGARLYRHGLQLELRGSYLDLLAFLRAVERHTVRFHWEALELVSEEHPQARAVLTLHTFSLGEAWIGA